ncbi:MAG: hypothetical protein WC807_16525 [Hyphomicrobium sp.]|jgi:hypothetical protein
MDFNPNIAAHRLLLAESIADFLRTINLPLTSAPRSDGTRAPSLQATLAQHGVHIARGNLTRIADLDQNLDAPAPALSVKIAAVLHQLGFWPPVGNVDRALQRVPPFFDCFDPGANRVLDEISGEFVSYQYSNRNPANILIGKVTIGPRTAWNYAHVTNYIEKTGSSANSIVFSGIGWSDNRQNIYMLLRSELYAFPTFILFDEIERPGRETRIETINGTSLGAARQHHRHLTAITLHRAPYPEDDSPVLPAQRDRLPKPVSTYMLMPLKNGPHNY